MLPRKKINAPATKSFGNIEPAPKSRVSLKGWYPQSPMIGNTVCNQKPAEIYHKIDTIFIMKTKLTILSKKQEPE